MLEFSLFRNDGAALYRPIPVRMRSYLSITEGISEEQLTEALKNFFKGRVRNYKRIALTLLQNLKTKKQKEKCAKKVFLPIHKKNHKILLVSHSLHGLLQKSDFLPSADGVADIAAFPSFSHPQHLQWST